MATGFVVSWLLFFLTHSYLNTRRHAHRIADELTAELRSRMAAERAMNERLQLQSAALDASANAIVITDANSMIKWANPAFFKMNGYTQEEALGRSTKELLNSGQQDQRFYECMWRTILAGKAWHGELINRRKDGTLFNEELTITPVSDEHGVITHFIAVKQDITARHKMEKQVQQLAFYDPLTQLPNRRLLNERLSQAMMASKRSSRYGALLFLDLDNFKSLNDCHGHAAGDLLLMEVARRLNKCVREIDTVARIGGDEFVVMLRELEIQKTASNQQARAIAEKIRIALSEPYALTLKHDTEADTAVVHHCTASIGVALFLKQDSSADHVLKWADAAMYQAKAAGRNQVRFYAG